MTTLNNQTPGVHRLVLESDTKNIHRVEEFFIGLNAEFQISEEKLHALLVAVTEAVNNGMIHGNKNDKSKYVTITCLLKRKMLTITITDEGGGFSPETLPNPLHDENLLRAGGRGVFLMRTLMESVTFNEAGNEVTMRLHI
ncbi:MAG TPA: ATP-binding protein [Bacteroidota bacterium]|nr:ATP-binding protein [Bacteroidota bacterium]